MAFCLVHAATSKQHPVLQQFGVSLDQHDLRHLVLSNRAACDALLAVAAYLQRHTSPGRSVFTLADGGAATFSMAQDYASTNAKLAAILKDETAAADKREELHWKAVLAKQALVATLRARLKVEQAQEEAARQKYSAF